MEVFKNILEYEDFYQVSNYGNVKRVGSNKCLRKRIQSSGKYHYVTLSKDGFVKNFRVHRLVAAAFIENPQNKSQVNHKDCDTFNNHIDNLEWCTAKENAQHSFSNGRNKPPLNFKGKLGVDHNRSKGFTLTDPDGISTFYGSGLEMKREKGFDNTSISYARKALKKSSERTYTFTRGKMKGYYVTF